MNVQANALKNAIKAQQVKRVNLHLTSNNRLIDCSLQEVFEKTPVKKEYEQPVNSRVKKAGIPSIYGISLKSIKTLTGREGDYYTGVVYKNGKKLGNWSQSPYGSIVDDYYFDEKELSEAAEAWARMNGSKDDIIWLWYIGALDKNFYYNNYSNELFYKYIVNEVNKIIK